jgi:cell division protein FtsB
MVLNVAIAIVAGTVLLTCAGRLAQFVTEPVVSIHRAGLEIKALRRERAARAETNDQLRKEIVYLNTNAGIEREARRRGWVKPGEVALSIVTPEVAPETAVAAGKPMPTRTASADHPRSIADRIRAAVDTCLAAFGGGTETR